MLSFDDESSFSQFFVVVAVFLLSCDDDSGVCDGELSAVGIVQWARQAMTVTMVMECGAVVVVRL